MTPAMAWQRWASYYFTQRRAKNNGNAQLGFEGNSSITNDEGIASEELCDRKRKSIALS